MEYRGHGKPIHKALVMKDPPDRPLGYSAIHRMLGVVKLNRCGFE